MHAPICQMAKPSIVTIAPESWQQLGCSVSEPYYNGDYWTEPQGYLRNSDSEIGRYSQPSKAGAGVLFVVSDDLQLPDFASVVVAKQMRLHFVNPKEMFSHVC